MGETSLFRVPADDIPLVMEGGGVLVRRIVGPGGAFRRVGPLLLLDHAEIPPEVGFPLHPHAGFEVLTYILGGELKHKDSAGFQATVGAGGAQHLFTGRGLWHEEMPGPRGTECLQIWVDLPAEARTEAPGYRSVLPDEIPEGEEDGVRRRLVAGPGGAVRFRKGVAIQDLRLEGPATLEAGPDALLYVLEGTGTASRNGEEMELAEGDLLRVASAGPVALAPREGALRVAVLQPPAKD